MNKRSIVQNVFVGLIFVLLSVSAVFAQTTAFTYQGRLIDMCKKYRFTNRALFIIALSMIIGAQSVSAQTTVFTYQGKLSDMGSSPTGVYQMAFRLFDGLAGGNQIGATETDNSVSVTQGVLTVNLDFGETAFDGTNRFLEIAVKRSAGDPFTILTPRQKIASAPYSIQSLKAATANNSTQLGGVDASQYVTGAVVKDLNGLTDNVTLAAGANITITPAGNTLTIGSTSGGVGGSGTTDSIPLWSGGTTLGNSLISQSGGTIQLPSFVSLATTPSGNGVGFGNPNGETGMTISGASGRADLRFDGTTLKLVAGLVGGPPPSTNGIEIGTSGKVGIGTTPDSGLGRLQVRNATNNEAALFAENTASVGSFKFGVYGRSTNGIGVFGQGIHPDGFGVYSDGFLGIRTGYLGDAGNTALCMNGMTERISSCSSSLRYKKDLQSFGDGLSFINQLNPISFKWKTDNMPDVGFGAEDVAKINPLFVTYNAKGEVEGVKYDRLSVVFVNAFKEQQKQIEAQQAQIENLKKLVCLDRPNADICQEIRRQKEE